MHHPKQLIDTKELVKLVKYSPQHIARPFLTLSHLGIKPFTLLWMKQEEGRPIPKKVAAKKIKN